MLVAAGSGQTGRGFTAALAFVAGLSVLVRPELALIGGLALVMMLIAARGWRARVLIVVAGGLLPVGYQIFRMGYYGLLVPGTALAKDASGKKWSQGFVYLANFNGPYALWVPALLLVVLGVLLLVGARPAVVEPRVAAQQAVARLVQSPTAVVVFIVVSGLVQALYWIRQGGDFMHGRVLLTPVFCMLAPVAVIPVVLPDRVKLTKGAGPALAGATAAVWLAVVGWALWAANSPGMGADATRVTYTGIVDERRFYAQATGKAHPLTAADYLDYPRMRAVIEAINNTPDGALLLPSGNYTQWDVVPADLAELGRRTRREWPAYGVLHQPGHARHERRARRPGGRPNRTSKPVGGPHRAAGGRQDRPRQEPFPGLGGGRGAMAEGAPVPAPLPRRGLGRSGGRGVEMPRPPTR